MPGDSYAMAKVRNETAARSFRHRSGADQQRVRSKYAELLPDFVADPGLRRRNIFACIDARDLVYRRAGSGADGI